MDNPGSEYIVSSELTYEEDGEEAQSVGGQKYKDEGNNIIHGKYYAYVPLSGRPVQIRPSVYVYTGENGVKTKVPWEETAVAEPADTGKAQITIDTQGGYDSCRLKIEITPWYAVDERVGFGYVTVFYRVKGEESWQGKNAYISNAKADIILQGLPEGTDLEYYIEFRDGSQNGAELIWSYGQEGQPCTVSTKAIEIYEDSQFPDAVFRNLVKKAIGISGEEKITGDKLEKLTRLSDFGSSDRIQSLEGIQYLTKLTSLSLYDHAVKNADQISSLAGLTDIFLSNNLLTTLPDLSGMEGLRTAEFGGNKIGPSEFVKEKLPAAFLEANPTWLADMAKSQKTKVKVPSQTEINIKNAELSWSTAVANTYDARPNTQAPYAPGKLSKASLDNAVNVVNFIRYVAGIPSNVVWNASHNEAAQAGALLNSVNGKLDHNPTKPVGCSDSLYQLGKTGCSRSNIAMGYGNLGSSIVNGWMYDGDSSNIGHVGHRRWVLNPTMTQTGFGAVNSYSAMYVVQFSSETPISDFVAWPAQNMPIELMGGSSYPWSVSLGTDYYIKDNSKVSVTLKDVNTGKTWTFNKNNSSYGGNYFSVNGGGYGDMGECIIFRPKTSEVSYAAGSRFTVSISGLSDKAGNAKTLSYGVNFFSLGAGQDISVSLNKTTLKMLPGQSEVLKATIKPNDVSDKTITWKSSNEKAAVVDQNGNVTAVDVGDAVITALSVYGKKATCKVSVRNYSLDKTQLNFDLAEGIRTETLSVEDGLGGTEKEVTFESSDESVAVVSKGGMVTPTGSGTARLRAEIKNGPSFECSVTVLNNVLNAIRLNVQECTLEKGGTKKLKVYFFPNDTTLSKEVTWVSDRPETAEVDSSGNITAMTRGTAIITATVGELEAKCSVTVTETALPEENNIPSGLFALTNVQTTLSDVGLGQYEGWEWVNGDIPLKQFAGMQEKSFAAVYHKEGYADYRTTLRVSLATLTGITLETDHPVLSQKDEERVRIRWKASGSEGIIAGYVKEIIWSSSAPDVVEVMEGTDIADSAGFTDGASAATEVILKAGTAGKAVIAAEVVLENGQSYKARATVKVTDGEMAQFSDISVDGFTKTVWEGADAECYEGNVVNAEGTLYAAVMNATKLTVKSSNAKVVTVGKARQEEGKYCIPLTVKAAGTVKITLTANDKAKTGKEIWLYVRDAKPNLGESSVTVNKLKTEGGIFHIYPNDGYTVKEYELTGEDAAFFEKLTVGKETDSYVVKAKEGTVKGKYKLAVKVTVSDKKAAEAGNASYELPFTVKVTEQKPEVRVRQSAKANLFYYDLGMPELVVTTKETLIGAELTECDFKLTERGISGAKTYVISPNSEGVLEKSCDKKGTLRLTFEGYETVISVPFTVGAEKKKPKLSLDGKTVTFYPNSGVQSVKIKVKSGGQASLPDGVTAALKKASGCELTGAGEELLLDGANLTETATVKEEIEFACANWTETICLPYTIKVSMAKPAVKLQKSSLKLNADLSAAAYDMAETEILWKGGGYFEPGTRISVSAANAASQEVINDGIVFEQDGNKVVAKVNNKTVAAGTYKFKVNAADRPGVSAPLTVKVVNTDLTKAVSASVKGSIDVLNRQGSFVTVTPSLKSMNGELVGVELSGKFAHLFRAELGENNKIFLYAKEQDDRGRDVALITKYNYVVSLVLVMQNAEGERVRLVTQEIKIRLKQSKPKVTVTPAGAAFFSGAYNSVKLDVGAALKGAAKLEITQVELINHTNVFRYSDGVLSLSDSGTAVKGKTYSLQFRISFRGQADNEKSVVVKYKAKVK